MYPLIYSGGLCTVMGDRIMKQKWDHPLFLVGCCLNSLFPEFEFVRDEHLRQEYRAKAVEF